MNLNLDGVSSNPLILLDVTRGGMGSFEKLVKLETRSLEREGVGGAQI